MHDSLMPIGGFTIVGFSGQRVFDARTTTPGPSVNGHGLVGQPYRLRGESAEGIRPPAVDAKLVAGMLG